MRSEMLSTATSPVQVHAVVDVAKNLRTLQCLVLQQQGPDPCKLIGHSSAPPSAETGPQQLLDTRAVCGSCFSLVRFVYFSALHRALSIQNSRNKISGKFALFILLSPFCSLTKMAK